MHRYERALRVPAKQQAAYLKSILQSANGSHWAKEIGLAGNTGLHRFREIVPIQEPGELSSWTDRIRAGEKSVLNQLTVERLVPTSGTTGPNKLIPMNAASRREFSTAVNLWISDLLRAYPEVRKGRCYIATSPAQSYDLGKSEVPTGFAEDQQYLSTVGRWIFRQILAVPPAVAQLRGENWKTATREHLLNARDLSYISIWHPSFLEALFSEDELCASIQQWPELRVLSSWSDGACAAPSKRLMDQLPQVAHSAKGLWLTEGVISLPWRGQRPLALNSAFLEFETSTGDVLLAHELSEGESYRPILTNHAGLFRYRLGDLIQVDGFYEATPSIRWMGRADAVSDLCGEKLSEAQVSQALDQVGWNEFAILAPNPEALPNCYRCFVSEEKLPLFPKAKFEVSLMHNPHYKWARDIGQLGPIQFCGLSNKTLQNFEDARRSSEHLHFKGSHLMTLTQARLSPTPYKFSRSSRSL